MGALHLEVEPKVYQPNTHEAYFFDLARPDSNGEYPVMRDDLISGGAEMYGSNFADFLERLLDEHPLWAIRTALR